MVFNVLRFSLNRFFTLIRLHSTKKRMQSQCRQPEIFWPGENKLHHRKARVYETICSRSLISRSFDSGPCEACLVSIRDNVLLLHSWDGRPYFILFTNTTLHHLGSVMLIIIASRTEFVREFVYDKTRINGNARANVTDVS